MSKKGENIYKRKDGRWEARYEKGRNEKGRIIYGSVYGKTYHEAREKKQQILITKQAVKTDQSTAFPKVALNEISMKWLSSIQYTIKKSTYMCYLTLIQKHILPYFGNYSCVSSDDIQRFINYKITAGLSPVTIQGIVSLLNRILTYGEENEFLPIINRNIVYPKRTSVQKRMLNHKQLSSLSCFLLDSKNNFELGILLCMHTGIRIGELCGLKYEDFDFENETFEIRRTVSRIRNISSTKYIDSGYQDVQPRTSVVITTPKSSSSIRCLPIPRQLYSFLKENLTSTNHYILTNTTTCMEPRNVQRKFRTILKKCNLPQVTFHSLRHSFATTCIENGVDYKALSEILGHSSVKITLDIYVHSNIEQKKEYINQLEF